MTISREDLARTIDHTLLKPDAPTAEIERAVAEAAEHGFATVCLPPCHVARAAELLVGTSVAVCTVIAFPFGYAAPEARIAESLQALEDGARELDTVINLSWLRGGEDARVADDLAGWIAAVRQARAWTVTKVILETGALSNQEKERAARLAVASGADFVKTSTGFGPGGATVADVEFLARIAAGRAKVTASGGIRDLPTALAMFDAGASRLGTSSGVKILQAAHGDKNKEERGSS